MNQGIEILLARMDSHPQEFCREAMYGHYGRWTATIDKVLAIGGSFTDEERKALTTKLYELERERFTQDVMKKLLHEPEEKTIGVDTVQVRVPNLYKYIATTWAAQPEVEGE